MIVAFLMIIDKQPSPPYQETCICGLAKEQLRVDRDFPDRAGKWLADRDGIEPEDLAGSRERTPNASKIAVPLFSS